MLGKGSEMLNKSNKALEIVKQSKKRCNSLDSLEKVLDMLKKLKSVEAAKIGPPIPSKCV